MRILLFISICVGIGFTATGIPSSSIVIFGESIVRYYEYSDVSSFERETPQGNAVSERSYLSGMASGAANGLVLGFGNTVVGGGSIGTAFAAGGIEAISGALSGGLTGGIDGGIRAAKAGVNIMSGKVGPMDISGHMGRSINDLSLPTYDNKPKVPSDKMYTVYVGYEKKSDIVRYVGITKREPEIRFQEHLRSKTPRANLDYRTITKVHSLTRMEARIYEQNMINKYGLKNLYNMRNEIDPKR